VPESLPPIDSQCSAVRNHTRHYAEFLFVYPVISRRSRGLSIGINLNPDKVCNFDCIYCEVDRRSPPRVKRVDLPRLRKELVALIRLARDGGLALEPGFRETAHLTGVIRDLAFSGDGEPTMIQNFAECVETVAAVKQAEGLGQTQIVLITNAAGLDKADVRRGLEIMDANQGEIWGKLDAGTEDYFKKANRTPIQFDRILTNLLETARVRPIIIQTLLLKVHGQMMPLPELEAYSARLTAMIRAGGRIKAVHAYTIARPTPEPFATKLTVEELEFQAAIIRQRTGLPVVTFA
jgi:wyosine [tRNA(Phe)-imidazoG37] synthetase (radical SAM superfamily)